MTTNTWHTFFFQTCSVWSHKFKKKFRKGIIKVKFRFMSFLDSKIQICSFICLMMSLRRCDYFLSRSFYLLLTKRSCKKGTKIVMNEIPFCYQSVWWCNCSEKSSEFILSLLCNAITKLKFLKTDSISRKDYEFKVQNFYSYQNLFNLFLNIYNIHQYSPFHRFFYLFILLF